MGTSLTTSLAWENTSLHCSETSGSVVTVPQVPWVGGWAKQNQAGAQSSAALRVSRMTVYFDLYDLQPFSG